jgi:hypothetical protein
MLARRSLSNHGQHRPSKAALPLFFAKLQKGNNLKMGLFSFGVQQ